MLTRINILVGVLLGALPSSGAQAQTYSVTPTYQASFAEFDPQLGGSNYKAWGLTAGLARPGHWWSPHVWVQRYELSSVCQGDQLGGESCGIRGWSVGMGPWIDFVDTDRFVGSFAPHVGLDYRDRAHSTLSAGFHVGVKASVFRPQVFGRFQMVRGHSFASLGVGVTFEVQAHG